MPQMPIPDFKNWKESSQEEYDAAPDDLPIDNVRSTKHHSRIIYFPDAPGKKDEEKYGVICFDCVKLVKVDSWAKH